MMVSSQMKRRLGTAEMWHTSVKNSIDGACEEGERKLKHKGNMHRISCNCTITRHIERETSIDLPVTDKTWTVKVIAQILLRAAKNRKFL